MPRLTAEELMTAAEGHGASFSYTSRCGLSAITPLIHGDGTLPSDEAKAVFAEVSERWDEIEKAARKRYVAERDKR